MVKPFTNRREAGRFLAQELQQYAGRRDTVVLALPRGGVPVAYEVATALHLPLEVFLVRKLGTPFHEELALGAIATGGVRVLNDDLIQKLGISQRTIDSVTAKQEQELIRRERLYRADRPPLELSGKVTILVDDGLATGASMRAAVQALRQHRPERIVVAVPVGARETCQEFETQVEEVVCGRIPEDLRAVGMWYEDFGQTTEEEVVELLRRAAEEHQVAEAHAANPERYRDVLTHDG